MRARFTKLLFVAIFLFTATSAQIDMLATPTIDNTSDDLYEEVVADINVNKRDARMDGYIGKELPYELIDEIIGAKSHCGNSASIPGSDRLGVGIYSSSDLRESSISVVVLSKSFYDENRDLKQLLIDYMIWNGKSWDRFKELYPNVQISFQNGLVYGYPDDYAFAIGHFDTTGAERDKHQTKAIKIWGVRKSDWKFVVIPSEGVYAINEGAGV